MGIWMWVVGSAQAAECPAASTPEAIEAQLAAAEQAFADLDPSAFVVATDHLALLQPCVEAIVPPALAARWHRVVGLKLYGQGDEAGATAAMVAARVLEPAYVWPDDLLPTGPLRAAYEGAGTAGVDRHVPPPREGALAFDGTVSLLRPADRASLVQVLDPSGRASETVWLLPASPLPAYPVVPRTRNRLLLAAGAASAGAVATYAGSWAARSSFQTWTPEPGTADPASSEAHLRSLRGTANGLAAGSLVLGVVATGGVVGALVVGQR